MKTEQKLFGVVYEFREDGGEIRRGNTVVSAATAEEAVAKFKRENRHIHAAKVCPQMNAD